MKMFVLGILNGLGEIWSHKLRSFLTIICVLLGVASLVLIVGLVDGLFVYWRVESQEMGGIQKLSVVTMAPPEKQKHLAGLSRGRTLEDAEAIRRLAAHAKWVSPEIDLDTTIRRKDKRYDVRTQGVTEGILPTNKYEVPEGRFIGDLDLAGAEPVVVLGSAVVRALYEEGEVRRGKVIGTQVTIEGLPFTVIGMLKHYELMDGEWNILREKNEIAFIPLTAMSRRLTGSDRLTWLNVQVEDVSELRKAAVEIENILMQTHRGVRDFKVTTREEEMGFLSRMETNFIAVGGGIGVVTLIVGGIGIMNLMLASINERIREIGIRKALGAWNRDIFVQFIAESVTLSAFGGACGILAGVGAIRVMQHLMKGNDAGISPPMLSGSAVTIGFLFSVVVGIVAGLYPAFRASRLDPIEALRYE